MLHVELSYLKNIAYVETRDVAVYIGWRWRHFNDFIYAYRC